MRPSRARVRRNQALKLRHLPSGVFAIAISASWLAMNALSHQNAASVNP